MGNVLVHFSHDLMCRNLAAVSGLSEVETRRFLFDDQWQWLMERGERSESEFCTELARRAGQQLDDLCVVAGDETVESRRFAESHAQGQLLHVLNPSRSPARE